MTTLQPGLTATVTLVVGPGDTATAFASGAVEVLATPRLVGLLEEAAALAVGPALAEEQTTVGTRVDMRHLAATPPGMTVRAKAVLLETDGRRCLFDVEAWDDVDKIAEGRHERFVVADLGRFLERANSKRVRGPR